MSDDPTTRAGDRTPADGEPSGSTPPPARARPAASGDDVAAARAEAAAALDGASDAGSTDFDELMRQASSGDDPVGNEGDPGGRDELMEMVRELRGELAEVRARSGGDTSTQALRAERDQLSDMVRQLQFDLQAARAQAADSTDLTLARSERDRLADQVSKLEADLAAAHSASVDADELKLVAAKRDEFAEMVKRLQGEIDSAKRDAIDPVVIDKLTSERDRLKKQVTDIQEQLVEVRRSAPNPEELDELRADRQRLVQVVRNVHREFDTFRKQTAHLRALARQAGLDAAIEEPELERIDEMDEPEVAPEPGVDPEIADGLARERDEYLESLRRLQAEFENFRKRTARDRAAESNRAGRQLVEDLLPVLDNLARAVENLSGVDPEKAAGVEMVLGQMTSLLDSQHVELIETAEGDSFDPELHEAVQALPSDSHPPGTIMAIVQAGYRFDDGTIIRPVRVVVANAADGTDGA